MIILRRLEIGDYQKLVEVIESDWGEFNFALHLNGKTIEDYKIFLKNLNDYENGRNLINGHVPSTMLFAFNESDDLIGRVSIRHSLNDFLFNIGGHIGYGVRVDQRRKGHATEILKLSLKFIKDTNLITDKVLVTCDKNNLPSIKVIEKNGGVLENIFFMGLEVPKLRYWIDLN